MFVQDWTKFKGKDIGNDLSVRTAINNRSTSVWDVLYLTRKSKISLIQRNGPAYA